MPKRYGESMVVFSAVNSIECVVDGAPVGKTGRLFTVPAGKAVKVPYEAGRFILDHLSYKGVVRVDETETETGIEYDIDKAKKESLALTATEDDKRFQQYVTDVVTDYLNQKKPAPRVPAAIQEIIDRRGYDLTKYGIFPLGQKETEQQNKMAALEADNKTKDQQLADLQAQVAQLALLVKGSQVEDETANESRKKKG